MYKNLAKFTLKDSGKYGIKAISNGSVAALGIPSPDPIDKYINIGKINANIGNTFFAKFVNPFVFATTNVPKIGNTTAVMQKSNKLIATFPPDNFPNIGGNIKFPAPKNIPNNIKLTVSISALVKLFFIYILLISNKKNPLSYKKIKDE